MIPADGRKRGGHCRHQCAGGFRVQCDSWTLSTLQDVPFGLGVCDQKIISVHTKHNPLSWGAFLRLPRGSGRQSQSVHAGPQ